MRCQLCRYSRSRCDTRDTTWCRRNRDWHLWPYTSRCTAAHPQAGWHLCPGPGIVPARAMSRTLHLLIQQLWAVRNPNDKVLWASLNYLLTAASTFKHLGFYKAVGNSSAAFGRPRLQALAKLLVARLRRIRIHRLGRRTVILSPWIIDWHPRANGRQGCPCRFPQSWPLGCPEVSEWYSLPGPSHWSWEAASPRRENGYNLTISMCHRPSRTLFTQWAPNIKSKVEWARLKMSKICRCDLIYRGAKSSKF